MSKSRFSTRRLATAGIIAGIYAALTLFLPIPQYGGVQLRAETVLQGLAEESVRSFFFLFVLVFLVSLLCHVSLLSGTKKAGYDMVYHSTPGRK